MGVSLVFAAARQRVSVVDATSLLASIKGARKTVESHWYSLRVDVKLLLIGSRVRTSATILVAMARNRKQEGGIVMFPEKLGWAEFVTVHEINIPLAHLTEWRQVRFVMEHGEEKGRRARTSEQRTPRAGMTWTKSVQKWCKCGRERVVVELSRLSSHNLRG